MKIDWKRNLLISWVGCFFTGASFSLVMPFIPLYIEELGAPESQIELFSGLAISVTAFAAAIIAPVWGNLADQKGRRLMMIRAAAGMTVTMGSLAFVPNVYWLLIMRFFTGILSGYIPNATALIASQAPREKSGWALGTLATGAIAGNLIGPSMGGALAQWFGMKNVFIITGVVLLITLLLTIFLVHSDGLCLHTVSVGRAALLAWFFDRCVDAVDQHTDQQDHPDGRGQPYLQLQPNVL